MDPWRLKGVVAPTKNPRPSPQWIDSQTLPSGVRIVPALGDAVRPLAALIIHDKDAFAGAVDAWTLRGYSSERSDFETRQIIARAAVAALTQANRLNRAQSLLAFRQLDALPRPTIYTGVVLPNMPRRYPTLQPKMPALAVIYTSPMFAIFPPKSGFCLSRCKESSTDSSRVFI